VETQPLLNLEDREMLRLIVRTTLACKVRGDRVPHFSVSSERLRAWRGAFVTLKREGRLRGCIGSLVGSMPLYETVQKMAIRAATTDPRFPPVRAEELPFLEIEISVLGPLRPIERIEEIVVGMHGLVMVHGNHSGVLLPQVAVENGWDRKTFLEHLSRKAGLRSNAWKSEDSRIYVFTAEVF
jgi:AmmeMemoRadiSam system protein A